MTETNSTEQTNAEIRPFRIDIPQADLDDLGDRLARTRWANELPLDLAPRSGPVPSGWEYGVSVGYVKDLVDHWRHRYDWRSWECQVERLPAIHHHDRRPEHPLPAHPLTRARRHPADPDSWLAQHLSGVRRPGRAADQPAGARRYPADAFHVVVPSLPGFAFSGPTTEAGWDALAPRGRGRS